MYFIKISFLDILTFARNYLILFQCFKVISIILFGYILHYIDGVFVLNLISTGMFYLPDPLSFTGHSAFIKNAVFSKDGNQIISASEDKTIR